MNWPLARELAGLLGAALAVIPWIRDYLRRAEADRLDGLTATADIEQRLDELKTEDQKWLSKAKRLDLFLTIGGLSLVAISFVIGIALLP